MSSRIRSEASPEYTLECARLVNHAISEVRSRSSLVEIDLMRAGKPMFDREAFWLHALGVAHDLHGEQLHHLDGDRRESPDLRRRASSLGT